MKVLDMGAYAILGYDWLQTHSPMIRHWAKRTLEFTQQDTTVVLQGIQNEYKQVQEVALDKCTSGPKRMIYGLRL